MLEIIFVDSDDGIVEIYTKQHSWARLDCAPDLKD
jgi:hypothetical protein